MSEDVINWLEQLGLAQYAEAFKENAIDEEVLPELTDADLEKMGVKLGHRKKLLKAIGALESMGAAKLPLAALAETPPAASTSSEAERRQLTVMFCDLVGSTELSQKLDPEDLREVNRAYQDACKTAIERYDGYVARYMGDGVLAYFGYPQAHEDDAERAVHAGLSVVRSIAGLSTSSSENHSVELGVRVGIATGPVVVGDLIGEGASQESAVIGETPNLAARLEGLAAKNTVVIGPGTHDLAGARFEYDDLGARAIKGIAEPVCAWRVISPSLTESRFEATRRAGLTPLVGREHEIGLLLYRWAQAKEGDGQVVLLSGEPGIGKSRISEILRESTAGDKPTQLRYQCSPFYTNSALYPVVQQLERACRFHPDDENDTKLDKLESLLSKGTTDVKAIAPLYASLLSVAAEGRYGPIDMTPERQKERTLDALAAQMEGLTRRSPVLLIFEDVHWADPTTLDLLELTIDRTERAPMLVVLTHRPEFTPPWRGCPHLTSLALSRFTRNLAAAMVRNLTRGKSLPEEVLQQIIERADGVPLFVEELTKTILESGQLREESNQYIAVGPIHDVMIPATLHDSLMARLDRLGAVKEVAQTAAAIGREFDYDLLAAVSPLASGELRDALNRLVGVELVFRRGGSEDNAYMFKHALVQDAAYGSLLKRKRAELHQRIALTLLDRFPEQAESEPELLAHHLREAGMARRAVEYWHKAGTLAMKRYANHEAVGHLSNGVATLMSLPDSTERDARELELQLMLISALTSTEGWGNVAARKVEARARELSARLGATEGLTRVLFSETINLMGVCDYASVRKISAELISISESRDDALAGIWGYDMSNWGAFAMGDFSSTLDNVDAAMNLYDPVEHHVSRALIPLDFPVGGLGQRTWSFWSHGLLDQSAAVSEEALALARELNHDSTLTWALTWAGTMPAALRRDVSVVERLSTELTGLPEERRSPLDFAWGQILGGWAAGKRGELEHGISAIRDGLRGLEGMMQAFWTVYLTLLTELLLDSGQLEEAQSVLSEAQARVSKFNERLYESEVIRLYAEMLGRSGADARAVESQFLESIKVAKRQAIKPLELRSSVSLGKLYQGQGKRGQAYETVASVYDRLTEGFDAADLKEASSLLEKSSESG